MSTEMRVPRIAAGTYRARAKGAQLCYTSKGREQVAVEFELLDDGWEHERITWYGYFGDTADKANKTLTDRTLESLMYAGWNGEDWEYFQDVGCNEVSLVIEHDRYEGDLIAKVRWVNRLGLAVKAPMGENDRKAFAARMKGSVLAVKREVAQAGGTNTAASQARPQARAAAPSQARSQSRNSAPPLDDERGPPVADDEIPF